MNAKPMTFGELLQRVAPSRSSGMCCSGPIVASLVVHDIQASQDSLRTWVILYGISDWETKLIHPQALHHRQYDVEIVASEGEVLRFVLDVSPGKWIGDLYQSSAKVVCDATAGVPTGAKRDAL
jgi:hypothetical protein